MKEAVSGWYSTTMALGEIQNNAGFLPSPGVRVPCFVPDSAHSLSKAAVCAGLWDVTNVSPRLTSVWGQYCCLTGKPVLVGCWPTLSSVCCKP